MVAPERLAPLPEDWSRALGVVAHPDDMEYGAASAVARWTDLGKDVRYLLVTRGEAGIATMPPDVVGPIREGEQRRSCQAVGVTTVEFLDHRDGLVEEGIDLRRDIATAIRRHQPEMILSINHRDSFGGPNWNHADHRAVGRAVLDAVRDAANPWIFPECGPAWSGVRFAAFGGSPQATHAVDVTGYLDRGIESLLCHELYLANLGEGFGDPAAFLRKSAEATGASFGVQHAAAFELVIF